MKTIHNSDIRFELNPRIIYVSDFEMTFYTVNKRDFSFRKTSADVQEVEVSGETKYYLDLDWSLLSYVGKGVLNYQCINNIADPSFPDGEYNQLVEKTTDYYIDTFKVEPESTDKSITELLGEEVEARIAGDLALSGAVNTEVDARIAGDAALSGAVDTALSGKQDTLIAGENIYISGNVISAIGGDLSNYYTKSEVDSALSGKADSDDVYTKGETSGKTEISTALDGKLDVTAYTPTDLSNYYTKSETSGKTEISTALATKLDTTAYTPTDLSNYYTKSETSGKTEISTALSAKADSTAVIQAIDQAVSGKADSSDVYLKSETSGKTEISTALATKLDTTAYTPTDLSNYYTKSETSGKTEISTAFTSISGAVDTALLGYVNNANYNTSTKAINLLHGNTVIASIDATDFIKDGMVDNVVISGGSLVITFNTDSGKEAITIALTDIFDPSNYYTKSDVDSALSGKADTTAVTEAINQAVSGKADSDDVYLKSETSGKTEISTALATKLDTTAYTPTDLSNYYTKGETSGATELNTAFSAKLDATAYTPTDLSNYYTKSETSGATELSTAFNAKQDTLIAGDNITISGNVISAAGGDLSNYYTKAEVDEMSEVAAQGINDLNTNKLDVTAYTPTDLSNYYTKSETSGKTEISTALGTKQDSLVSGTNIKTINNESILGSGNITIQGGGSSINVVQTTGTSSGDVMSQNAVTTALATKLDTTAYTPTDLSNYYTKSETSGATEISTALSGKLDTTAYTPTDLSNYYTKSETSGATEISTALSGKLDTTAYTPTDLSNYYTKSETSGATELTTAFTAKADAATTYTKTETDNAITAATSTKQDSLVSGTNIKTINNESILGSGNITIQGGGSSITVVQTTGTSSGDVMSQDAVTTVINTVSGAIPSTYVSAIEADNDAGYQRFYRFSTPSNFNYFLLRNAKINGRQVLNTGWSSNVNEYNLVETSAITTSVTSSSTDAQVPSAKAVYDAIQEGGGGSSINVVQTTGTSTGDVMSQDAVTTALASKQGTLVSGTNIKTINNESILGSGNIDIEGGNDVVELTQAQYNALVTSGTVDPDVFYIITDATPADLTNYYTKSETSGKTEISTALSAKLDTTAYTPTDLSNYYTKSETSGATEISTALSGKQETLTSGTNIKTINNESILGSGNITIEGGGKAVSGGTNISITTGETADTINCTLPITINSNKTTILPNNANNTGNGSYNFVGGRYCKIENYAGGSYPDYAFCYGYYNTVTTECEAAFGTYNQTKNVGGAQGISGTTIFTIGNGNWNTRRHNALEVMQNGDIYIANTDDTSTANYYQKPMVRLQDLLGGGSITIDPSLDSGSTNPVANSAITTAINAKADAADLGGLKLQQVTQAEYDAITNKDASTLYVIVN